MTTQQKLNICTRATQYWSVAAEYLETYTIVAERKPKEEELTSPKLFLLCHALETAMKGWIVLENGTSTQKLKSRYSHDLVKLARAAGKHYPRVEQNLGLVELLNASYWGGGTRDYEYPEGNRSFISIKPENAVAIVVRECVDQLISAIEQQRRAA